MKKPRVLQLFRFIFWVCNVFFLVADVGWPGSVFLWFWTRFWTHFRNLFKPETLVVTVFLSFVEVCLTAIFKDGKTIVNTVNTNVLCCPVAKNLANTTVFGRWVKKHCKLRCFWPPDLQKHRYLQWFLPPKAQKDCKKRHFCRFFFMFQLVSCFELGWSDRRGMHIYFLYIYILYIYIGIDR